MKIPRLLFTVMVVAAFGCGLLAAKAAGVWVPRTRHLPPAAVQPAPAAPEPGGLPM